MHFRVVSGDWLMVVSDGHSHQHTIADIIEEWGRKWRDCPILRGSGSWLVIVHRGNGLDEDEDSV